MTAINKETALHFLSNVTESTKFYCHDGKVFSKLEELEIGLKHMTVDVFKYHVNKDKNDFCNWIYDVIGDVTLADSLRKTRDKKTILKLLRSRIDELKGKAK